MKEKWIDEIFEIAVEIVKKYKPNELIDLAVKIADENNDGRLKEMGL